MTTSDWIAGGALLLAVVSLFFSWRSLQTSRVQAQAALFHEDSPFLLRRKSSSDLGFGMPVPT